MPGFVGLPEIILFGIVALLIFGPKKLPEMGRSLGRGMREFKDSVSGSDRPVVDGTPSSSSTALAAADSQPSPFTEEPTPAETNVPVR